MSEIPIIKYISLSTGYLIEVEHRGACFEIPIRYWHTAGSHVKTSYVKTSYEPDLFRYVLPEAMYIAHEVRSL